MHLHLRDGPEMSSIVTATAARFARAIVMPNLKPPVTTVEQALAYRGRILDCVPAEMDFEPLMTLYLTDNTSPDEIEHISNSEYVHAVKYYPAGATTNSENGVTSIDKVRPVLEKMALLGVPLLLHGEVTDPGVDIFDREQVFIDSVLVPLTEQIPELRIVFEHITTSQSVQFVEQGRDSLAATITPQHLLYNRNAIFQDGLNPHYYCLPVLKRESHRQVLVAAATGGNSRFFLGTDSAPHARSAKENHCGCAGIYSAPAAIEIYAEIFEQADALDRLEAFASCHGADFYGLPRNEDSIRLEKTAWTVPATYPFGDEVIVPLKAGKAVKWKLAADG